jgi:hypothetical protein
VFLGDIDLSVCFGATQHGDAEDRNYRSQSCQLSIPKIPVQNVTVA